MYHKILELLLVLESFDIWAEMQKENHFAKVRKTGKTIIEKCEVNSLGTIAIENINEEMNQLKDVCMLFDAKEIDKTNKIIDNCSYYHLTEFGIPCLCKL